MTSREEYLAAEEKIAAARQRFSAKRREIKERLDRPGEPVSRQEIVETSLLIEGFWLELDQLPKGKGGYATGRKDAGEAVWEMVSDCHWSDIPPPNELVDALAVCLGIYKRVEKAETANWKEQRSFFKLVNYLIDNPGVDVSQAAKDTGIPRTSVQRYKDRPILKKYMDNPELFREVYRVLYPDDAG